MKDPKKWKGRALIDPEEVAEKERLKKVALEQRILREQSRALRKFQAQRRKELRMKYAKNQQKARMQQLGIFRALVSGVGSLQLKLCFSKWVEYLEIVRQAKEEVYRRRRWQLSCPESHIAGLAGKDDLEPQQINLYFTGGNKNDRKYIVEGDERCSAALVAKDTSAKLPMLIPRFRAQGLAQPAGKLALNNNIMRGGIGGYGHNPVKDIYGDHVDHYYDSHKMGHQGSGGHGKGSHGHQHNTSLDTMDASLDGFNGTSSMHFDGESDHEEESDLGENWEEDEHGEMVRKRRKPGQKAFKAHRYLFDSRGNTQKRFRGGLPAHETYGQDLEEDYQLMKHMGKNWSAHETYGHDPDLVKYDNQGIHWRTGRPVRVDSHLRLYKFAYDSPRRDLAREFGGPGGQSASKTKSFDARYGINLDPLSDNKYSDYNTYGSKVRSAPGQGQPGGPSRVSFGQNETLRAPRVEDYFDGELDSEDEYEPEQIKMRDDGLPLEGEG